ncbi:MAG: hypothetical protein MK052_08100 [Alphaproteobacteria bacterium]|nr:hypothetical protein [Alphaproteobacteria bacterium]
MTDEPTATNTRDAEEVEAIRLEQANALHTLVAEQIQDSEPKDNLTVTELLADEKGAFAQKVQELGLSDEWKDYKSQQGNIGELREECLTIEKKRNEDVNRVANIRPDIEAEAGAVRKAGAVGGAIGAVALGATTAISANRKNFTNPVVATLTAVAGVAGAAVGGIVAAKRRARKGLEKFKDQIEDLGDAPQDPKLAERSAELQNQIGQAQQECLDPMLNVMVERMTDNEVQKRNDHDAALTAEAERKAAEAAARDEEQLAQSPQEHAAAPSKDEAQFNIAESPVPQSAADSKGQGAGLPSEEGPSLDELAEHHRREPHTDTKQSKNNSHAASAPPPSASHGDAVNRSRSAAAESDRNIAI